MRPLAFRNLWTTHPPRELRSFALRFGVLGICSTSELFRSLFVLFENIYTHSIWCENLSPFHPSCGGECKGGVSRADRPVVSVGWGGDTRALGSGVSDRPAGPLRLLSPGPGLVGKERGVGLLDCSGPLADEAKPRVGSGGGGEGRLLFHSGTCCYCVAEHLLTSSNGIGLRTFYRDKQQLGQNHEPGSVF